MAGEELGQETEYTVQRAWGVLFRKKVLKTERDREREGEGETEKERRRERRGERERQRAASSKELQPDCRGKREERGPKMSLPPWEEKDWEWAEPIS